MILRIPPLALINSIYAWCPEVAKMREPIVAGGFNRAYYAGEKPKDMDIFFENESNFNCAKIILEENKWNNVFETDRAISFNKENKIVQLIKFSFQSLEKTLDIFDFTICMAGVAIYRIDEGEELKFDARERLHDNFFEHLAARLLVYNNSSMPLSSLKRAFQYIKKGYNICDENIINLAENIAKEINFDNEEEIVIHTEGLDPEGGRRIRAID